MKSVTVLSILLLLAGMAGPPKPIVELSDPVGDVMGPHGKDLTKAVLTSDGSKLSMTFTFTADVAATLAAAKMAGSAVEVLLDTDNDPKTGGKTFSREAGGFEASGKVRACIRYQNGSACAGGLGGAPIAGYYAALDLATLKQGTSEEDKRIRNSLDDTGRAPCELKGSTITVALPYQDLGLKPGQILRVALQESDGNFNDAWFPDVSLQLK